MGGDKMALNVITVINPEQCLGCKSARIAEVLFSDNSVREMFYCSRLDCDNWERTSLNRLVDKRSNSY